MNIHSQNIQLIQNGNATLAVHIHSTHKTETIILLHGGPGVPDHMIEVVEKLKNDFNVITFEQRGVGASTCKNSTFTMGDYISDIDTITEKLGIETFHLFGHSWGGLYAQIYALERPEKIESLFLCSPSSGTNRSWKKTEKEVMLFHKKITSKKEWLKMGWHSLLGMLGNNKAYRKLFEQVLNNYYMDYSSTVIEKELLNKIFSAPINKTRKEIIKYKPLPVADGVNYPIMITYGSHDIYGESKNDLFHRFPSAKIEIISNCGHIPWKNNRSKFDKILVKHYLR